MSASDAGTADDDVLRALAGRSFLAETDVTVDEWHALLRLSSAVKDEHRRHRDRTTLRGRAIALVFEKESTRTRSAFERAAFDLGIGTTQLDTSNSHLGDRESIADTAHVLGRIFDGIEFRGFAHASVEELARNAGVPVWNGLTDQWHPTQSLCDVLTMTETTGRPTSEIAFAFLGDCRNNVASSLAVAGAMSGMDVRLVGPPGLAPSADVVATADRIAATTGAKVRHTADVAQGVAGVDVVYTDVWLSMGEPQERWKERVDLLSPYRVTASVLAATGNPDVAFMHCLPSFHDRLTSIGERLYEQTGLDGLEVSDDVFSGRHSVVFDQAENRMHTIKALLVATLGGLT